MSNIDVSLLLNNINDLKKRLDLQESDSGPTTHGGPPTGGGSNLEARVARLESDVEYIKRDIGELKIDVKEHRKETHSDFRVLFGALITATAGLAGLMAKGFGWI